MTCVACGRLVPAGLLCACGVDGPALESKTSGLAIAGLVISFFCGFIGLALSLSALDEIKKSGGRLTGGGLAIGGVAVSILSMLLNLAMALNR